jgi:uroporphyrinogen-III synthase
MDRVSAQVLVTRAEPGAAQTARRLLDLGWTPVVAPLLRIVAVKEARIDLSGVQAVLFSSANGVRAFADLGGGTDVTALCVGDATALAAREAGFRDVRSAEGDATALAILARTALDPHAGAVLWASGEDVARDVGAILGQSGFEIRRAVLYRAEPEARLPEGAARTLRGRALCAVLFHSARAAEAFAALAADARLGGRAASVDAICISGRVAEAARTLAWARVVVAESPDEDAMLAALGRPD